MNRNETRLLFENKDEATETTHIDEARRSPSSPRAASPPASPTVPDAAGPSAAEADVSTQKIEAELLYALFSVS